MMVIGGTGNVTAKPYAWYLAMRCHRVNPNSWKMCCRTDLDYRRCYLVRTWLARGKCFSCRMTMGGMQTSDSYV